jgi:uncharacterized protein (TIGR00369 family)
VPLARFTDVTLSIPSPDSGSAADPWRQPVRGGHPDARHLALSGADQLRAMLSCEAPEPPIARLTGTRIVDAAPGTATFELPLSAWLRGPDGRASSGLLTMPVDAAMACAIMTGLREVTAGHGEATYALPATGWLCAPPPGRVQGGAVAMLAEAAMTAAARTSTPPGAAFRTAELKLNYRRPLAADGREASAHARVLNAGRRFILAGAEVRDADERLIAMASGSVMAAG